MAGSAGPGSTGSSEQANAVSATTIQKAATMRKTPAIQKTRILPLPSFTSILLAGGKDNPMIGRSPSTANLLPARTNGKIIRVTPPALPGVCQPVSGPPSIGRS